MGWKNFALLIFLASLWGPSFLFIKVAIAEIPPITLAAGRISIAAVVLYLILLLNRQPIPTGAIWKKFAIIGFFANALPFALISWGEQYVDSALASIINGTVPIFTIIIAHFFTTDERLTLAKVSGIILGLCGLLLMIIPSIEGEIRADTWGLIGITIAAVSYGIAIVYTRIHLQGLPPLTAPMAQLTMASLFLLPLSLFFEQPYNNPLPSFAAISSILILGLFSTALAFVIFYTLIERTSATYSSTVTYLMPIIGIFLGVVVLGEQPGWNAYIGGLLILIGVMVVNGLFTLPAQKND